MGYRLSKQISNIFNARYWYVILFQVSVGDELTFIKETGTGESEEYYLVESVIIRHVGGFHSTDDKFTVVLRKYHAKRVSADDLN